MSDDSDSVIYGVDYKGKVWALSTKNGSVWNKIPNPTKVNIKRLMSYLNILWGIGSDHQVYVYVFKKDIPIRVREVIYENQRWNPVGGFTGEQMLPTDRARFSNEEGTEARQKSDFLPSTSWQWEDEDWQIENIFGNTLVAEGWTYAVDFPATYYPEKTFKSFVRRRKLFRHRTFVGTNRWNKIESLHKDYTQEPFIDISVGGLNLVSSSETKFICLWAISIIGEVYFRFNTTMSNPEGSGWQRVPVRKGLEACQLTVASSGQLFVVTWTGTLIYRVGQTPQNLQGTDWLESNGPPSGFLQLSAGTNSLWGISRDKKCYALKGNLSEVVAMTEPVFEWIEIPGKMKNISVGKSDDVVLALSDDETSSLFHRIGITEEQKYGQGWQKIYNASWDSLSVASSASDAVDGTITAGESTESLVSLQPELPHNIPLLTSNKATDDGPNSFCWVDGACASYLRVGLPESDLEIGPWRDNILSDLQKLKTENSHFSYPDALEPSTSCWSKSSRIKFLHMSRNPKWIDGHLEISNNNHLMFHENLQRTWLCSMKDVLSIFSESRCTLTCRIRNSITPGVAEYVSFQYTNEKETADWRSSIIELQCRPLEDFSLSDIWLTTRKAETLRGGLVRILDSPVEAEVLTETGAGQFHHPLVQGFLPHSELIIDLTVPKGGKIFSVNLQGRTSDTIAFHFNPRLVDGVKVVRNSLIENSWGREEAESPGAFPFKDGESYTLCIQCTPLDIVTTVIHQKNKFIYNYLHRVPPKSISNLMVDGDCQVEGVRYEPKISENYELEFATQTVEGHFWKVEGGGNSSVWALGCDLKVWFFTGGTLSNSTTKFENMMLGMVTDEQVYEIYENERWNPLTGFGTHFLPTDRCSWTDETGRIRLEKDEIKLPPGHWVWISDWQVDYETRGGVDKCGWQYAIDFPSSYHSMKKINDFVRRRKWIRKSKLTVIGPWVEISGMKLIDIAVRMNEECDWEVIGLTENGDPVVRDGITPECPVGKTWRLIPSQKPMISISGWFNQSIWGIGKDGFSYILYGKNTWQMLDRPDSPLKIVKVGSTSIFAVGINNALYRRSGVQAVFPEGNSWVLVCTDVMQVGIAPDGSVWALLKEESKSKHCSLAKRMGISSNSPHGLGWQIVANGPWQNFSVAGCFSRNK